MVFSVYVWCGSSGDAPCPRRENLANVPVHRQCLKEGPSFPTSMLSPITLEPQTQRKGGDS
jgi:hypothetical protein